MALDNSRPRLAITVAAGLLAGMMVLVWSIPGARADWRQLAPFCAFMGGSSGFDCSYYTFEQCMETARGLGGYCSPNPRLRQSPYPPPSRVRRPYR
ncbi:MAG TPA: DUF3551 domain-containing protein [Xanthobacteraceae bacterium]|jgi:hypothetical protein